MDGGFRYKRKGDAIKAYHVTPTKNIPSIKKQGLIGFPLVCLAYDINLARRYSRELQQKHGASNVSLITVEVPPNLKHQEAIIDGEDLIYPAFPLIKKVKPNKILSIEKIPTAWWF